MVVFAESADATRIGFPKLITPALAVLIPFSIVYWCMAIDKVLGYLAFFPVAKGKKKFDDTAAKTVEFGNLG